MLTLLADDFSPFPFAEAIGRAIAEGRPAILLVPEQLALATEKAVAQRFPPSAPLTFEVSNFSRLADRVFRKEGGLSFRYADRAAEIILMWKALDAAFPFLITKKRGATDTVRESLAMLSETTTSGVSPAELRRAAATLPDGQRLKEKLSDLALVTEIFEGERGAIYGSLAADLDKLLSILKEKPVFADTEIYVSGFTSFTAGEYAVLGEIMRRGPLAVSLPLPEASVPSLAYEEVTATKRTLLSVAERVGCKTEELPPLHRDRPPMLEHAKRMLFRADGSAQPYPEHTDGTLSFVLAKDPYEGCAHVAAEIARAVRAGARYCDFTVLTRAPEKYDGVLDDALNAEGIPFFFSKSTDITELSLSKMILAAFAAIERGFPRSEVIAYLKCGFTGISEADADLFEIYAETWRLKGRAFSSDIPFDMSPDGYVAYRNAESEEKLARLNDVRVRLLSPLWALGPATAGEKNATEHATALYRFLCDVDAERTLLQRAREESLAGRTAEAERLSRIFGVLCDLLDRIVEIMGDTPLTRGRFSELLSLLFSSVSLGTIPMLQDSVTVMSADTYRPTGEHTVFLLGANEGEFPASVGLGGAFPEEEREALAALGVTVGKPPELRASREQFSFLRGLATPTSRAVVVAFENGAMGESLRPSAAYRQLLALFPDIKETRGSPEIYSPRAALERYFERKDTPEGEAIRELLADTPLFSRMEALTSTPLFDPGSAVSAENAARLFPAEMTTSQSAIDGYLDCPFAYYCRNVLRLSEDAPAALHSREVGNMMHAVLESFFHTLDSEGRSIREITPEEIPTYVERAASRYVERLCPPSLLASPRLSHLLSRVRRAAVLVCRDLYDEFTATRFEPRFYELKLEAEDGPGRFVFTEKEPLAQDTGDGAAQDAPLPSVGFRGTIDRVDVYRSKDGEVFVRVVDYKTGERTFSRDKLKKCRNLQMFIYLCAVWKSENAAFLSRLPLNEGERPHPAGIVYNTVDPKAVTLKAPLTDDALTDSIRAKNLARNGFFLAEKDVVDAMDDRLAHTVFPRDKGGAPDLSKKNVFGSEVEFGEMLDETEEAVLTLARRMRAGRADIAPDPDTNRCPDCAFRTVCRNENFKAKKY